LWPFLALGLLLWSAAAQAGPSERRQAALPVDLIAISTDFNNPIGIDHHAPSHRVVMSVNYPSGLPYNFELVGWDGAREQFSSVAGLSDEIKIGTVRQSDCQAGFEPGALFTGTGLPGEIARIAADGRSIDRPWVSLPGETGLMRGGLFQDLFCVMDGDLLVVTTTGGVWRIDAAGTARRLADLATHLEGVTSVPDDALRYGPWAGRILTGSEGRGEIYAIAADGQVETFALGIAPEDFDIVPPNANFFGVDFSAKRLVGAPAAAWRDKVGDVVVAQESGQLWDVRWDALAEAFEVVEIARVSQWEHVTFSTAGLIEIPTPTALTTASPTATSTPTASPTATASATRTPEIPEPGRIYLPIISELRCALGSLDIVLVLDLSTSMRRQLPDGEVKLEVVLAAAGDFVSRLDPSLTQVAVVGFNDRAWIESPLGADLIRARSALAALPAHMAEGTRLDRALETGMLALSPARPGASTVLLLLTDGLPNRVPTPAPSGSQEDSVLALATEARSRGILIYSLGVGQPDAEALPDRINAWLLREIAGDPERYFEARDASALQGAWRAIGELLRCPQAGRLP
jgi:hypothetical protein